MPKRSQYGSKFSYSKKNRLFAFSAILIFVGLFFFSGNIKVTHADDSYTKLLLHGDGTNGSTVFIDSSGAPKTVTASGNAQIATTQSKFGGASMSFDGNGDYLTVPDSTDWDFGSGDFTIDFWMRANSLQDGAIVARSWVNRSWMLYLGADGKLWSTLSSNGTTWDVWTGTTSAGAISANTWYHIALVRSGNNFTTYINGTSAIATTTSASIFDSSNVLHIGGEVDSGTWYSFNGMLDELRISKGIARWTANFTPPTNPYVSVDSETKLLLHADGTNGSTSFADSSATPKTVTANGNAQVSTAQSKFGGASASFDGTGDYLSVPSSTDFNFGTGDFTIDWWEYRTTNSSGSVAIARDSSSSYQAFALGYASGTAEKIYMSSGIGAWDISNGKSLGTASLNQWSHLAVVRSGNNFYAFKDGTQTDTWTSSLSLATSSNALSIGRYNNTHDFQGYIDELRISEGIARWTSNFTPPASAYDAASIYTLTYTAGSNGTISGSASQSISQNGSGTAVTAVPSTGYHFVNWSDSSTSNPRTDSNVQANISVTANFAINTYTLDYTAGSHGTLSGTVSQTVNYNANGTAVTAVADANYAFVNWNDGSTQNPRTDANVTSNKAVTANFALDNYAKLLLHSDGANNSTIFADSSSSPKTVTAGGNAKISTTQNKFGGASGYLDGSGDYLSIPASADFNFGSSPFAIDFWFYRTQSNVQETFLNSWQNFNATNNWATYVDASNKLGWYPQGYQNNTGPHFSGSTSVSQDTWHHVAFTYDGSVCRIFLDGALDGSLTVVAGSNSTQAVIFGINSVDFVSQPFKGYLDELRVTKGLARWTSNFTPPTSAYASAGYSLTYIAGSNGTISGSASQSVSPNGNGTAVTAVPSTGYHFVNWSDSSTSNPKTDSNVQANISVTANFAINTYTLTYSAGSNGTLTGTSPQTVNYGASGTAVAAVPGTNYHFVNWSDSSTSNPRTDSNISSNLNLTANFAIDTHTVTFNKNGGDTEANPTTRTADHDATVTLPTAPTKTGYTFVSWNTSTNGSGTAFTASTAVTGDLTVYAQWTIDSYTLTYTAGSNGTLSGTSPQTVNYNASGTTITANPATGYHFVNWSDSSAQNPRMDTNVTSNVTVTANFAINTYSLAYAAGSFGAVTGTTAQTVSYGANGTAVTAVPLANYHFVKWSDNSTQNPRTDTDVTNNIDVTAGFAINSYTLTYTAGTNGSLSGTASQTVNYSTSGTAITAVPDAGYHFTNWSDNSTNNPRTDTNVTNDLSVTANFAIDTNTVSFNKNGGDIEANPTTRTADYNTTVALPTAPTKTGYAFAGWNTQSNGSGTSFTSSTAVISDLTVYAQWTTNSFTLTYAAGVHGTVTGTTPQAISGGQDGSQITAVPSTGYHFVNWSDSSASNPRTDTNIQANLSVTANFAINTYALTYSAGSGGTLSGTTSQTISYNASGTAVNANPSTGYHFVNWSDGSTNNPRTDANVTQNKSVTANFTLNGQTIDNPTPQKITAAYSLGAFTLSDGTIGTSTTKATTATNLTLVDNGNFSLTIPVNTEITNKTVGQPITITNFTTQDITDTVQSVVASSKAAIKIGIPNVPLTFSQDVTISFPVSSSYNNETLTIYSKPDNSSDWTYETTCHVTNNLCSFTTRHATEFTANYEVSNSPDPTHVNMDINSTITISCKDANTNTNDYIAMNPITGTGKSAANANNDVNCNIITNNSSGYTLSFASSTPELKNSNNDTIHSYTPQATSTPETWSVSTADSEWGARLISSSSTYDPTTWGTAGTDDYTAKWYAVTNQNNFILANRSTETAQTGDSQIIRFGAEIGSSKFQPTGTYTDNVTFTAVTN